MPRRLPWLVLFLAWATSCGGLAPVSEPVPLTVPNAMSMRLGPGGLAALGPAIGGLVVPAGKLAIGLPETPIAVADAFTIGTCPLCLSFDLEGSICPGGPDGGATPPRCIAEVEAGAFTLASTAPNAVTLAATLSVQLDDTPISLDVDPGPTVTLHVGYGANGTCVEGVRPSVSPRALPVTVTLPLTAGPDGATRLDVDAAVVDLAAIAPDDVTLCASCPADICNPLLDSDVVKGPAVTQLRSALAARLKDALRAQPLPALGFSGHADLGAIAPGAGLDLALRATGPALADGQGLTLTFAGGARPAPISACAPPRPLAPPLGIPVPDEVRQGTAPLAAAVSGRFLEYALGEARASGALCLETSTAQVDMLRVGLLSFLAPSLKTLTFDKADAAAAVATRPQEPPRVTVGTSPLLSIALPAFAIDFYVWSFDRFARVFTYEGDVTLPMDLAPAGDRLAPVIGTPAIANGRLTNADALLLDDPGVVAAGVTAIFATLAQQFVGQAIPPVALPTTLGVNLRIDRVQKLTKDGDDFVGLFGSVAPAAAPKQLAAALEGKTESSLTVAVTAGDEAAYWIDGGTRSPWRPVRDGRFLAEGPALAFQGRHVLHVVTRSAGGPETARADVPYVMDRLAPFVKLARHGDRVEVEAWDLVSTSLLARHRRDDGAFGPWAPLAALDVQGASVVEVEVKDEEGNVTRAGQRFARGGGGCAMSPGGSTPGVLALLALCLLLRRRRALALAGTLAATASCGSDGAPTASAPRCGATCAEACQTGLERGQPGAYLSVAKAKDGAVWAAGYNDTLLAGSDVLPLGDLVVGRFDAAGADVAWHAVDGVPARTDGTCPVYDPRGWRAGETAPGDDVGRYASLALTASDRPIVAYRDDTHRRVKVAYKDAGGWHAFVLREGADAGRFTKLVIAAGKPVVVFQELAGDAARVVVARATVAEPRGSADFTFEDAAVQGAAKAPGPLDPRPLALGSGLALAAGPAGLGLLAYDAGADELAAFFERPGGWDRMRVAAGGEDPALAIGPDGVWHVAFGGGAVHYLALVDRVPGPIEIVDDGARPDGKHRVGADAAIALDPLRIAYADATALGVRRATRTAAWHHEAIGPADRLVAFPRFVPGETRVAAWWRKSTRETQTVDGSALLVP